MGGTTQGMCVYIDINININICREREMHKFSACKIYIYTCIYTSVCGCVYLYDGFLQGSKDIMYAAKAGKPQAPQYATMVNLLNVCMYIYISSQHY